MLRTCRRNGWSIEQTWETLSEWERAEWMAYDHWLMERLEEMTHNLADKQLYTPESYVMLVKETL